MGLPRKVKYLRLKGMDEITILMQSEGHGKIMFIPKMVLGPSVHCQIALLKFPRKEPKHRRERHPFL